MKINDPRAELDQLLQRLSDGELQPADATRLNELLRGDPEACERYLNHATLEAQLHREFGGTGREVMVGLSTATFAPEAATKVIAFPLWLRYAAAAALAVCATWLALSWRAREEAAGSVAVNVSSTTWLATVLLAEDCEWERAQPLREGERVAAGVIRLTRGLAVLRFDGGAELVLRGGTELELQSAAQARLIGGEVTVRATEGAEGFRLLTPASEVVDLGTEFAVKVERTGATEVHVIEGEVAWHKQSLPQSDTVVAAGNAVRFDRPDAAAPRTVAMSATGFDETVRKAQPRERPDLMTHYDGFFYEAGSYQPSDIVKGKGWAGPWRLRLGSEQRHPNEIDSTTDMRIVEGGLSVPWPIPGGKLGGLEMPAGRSFRLRPMKQGIDMGNDGITYFSLITYEPEHGKKRRTTPVEGVRLTFRSSADYWNESLSFGCQQSLRPLIQAGAQGSFASAAAIADEQSLLWIGKIIRRADGEDEVFFRIYGQADALDYAEPATWHSSTRGLRQNAVLDLVILSSTGQSPRIVDELRIGPTWRSVVPMTRTNEQ